MGTGDRNPAEIYEVRGHGGEGVGGRGGEGRLEAQSPGSPERRQSIPCCDETRLKRVGFELRKQRVTEVVNYHGLTAMLRVRFQQIWR